MKRCLLLRWGVAALASFPIVAFAGPYGSIESGDRSQTRKQEPVAITRIDGQSTLNPRRPDPVAPGKHTVEIGFSSARAVVGDTLKTIEIDVQPCRRYRVVAQYHNTTSGKWDPVIAAVDDIGECKRKFMPDKSGGK